MIARFERSGLAWPVPPEIGDAALEANLCGAAAVKPWRLKLPEPDWSVAAREMKRKHGTPQLLWEEHIAEHPDGHRNSPSPRCFDSGGMHLHLCTGPSPPTRPMVGGANEMEDVMNVNLSRNGAATKSTAQLAALLQDESRAITAGNATMEAVPGRAGLSHHARSAPLLGTLARIDLLMLSLIATAKLNDIDPRAWLANVVAGIADIPQSRLGELLPWNWRSAETARQAA